MNSIRNFVCDRRYFEMSQAEFSYNDLVLLIDELSGNTNSHIVNLQDESIKEYEHLICLDNQFFHVIKFPEFKTIYISPTVENILGYNAKELTLRRIFKLIHPDDYHTVLLAIKKMYEIVINNYDSIEPFKSVTSMDFRIRTKKGNYIRLLNQNCLLKKGNDNKEFKSLALSTDISNVKNDSQIEFKYVNKGDKITATFPDQELTTFSSKLTHREKEILSLIALGKNSQEIGEKLHISKHTVDTHRRKMLSKTKFANTTELVAYTINNHLLDN